MGKLTSDQKNKLKAFLEQKGLSFKPLLDEMVDHISCDLEERMEGGFSFHDAWHQSVAELPDNHFQTIQQDVMETINKRFSLSRSFSFIAIGLLLISTSFKILHLQFAGEVLLLSFVFIAAALLTTSISGIFLTKDKKGARRVLAEIIGILVLIVGFSFKILHLPGADTVIITGVGILIIALLVNTIYVYQHSSGEGNFLTYLLEKYTPGIERFFLFLLLPLVAYTLLMIITHTDATAGSMLLLVVILGSGLYFIALVWRRIEMTVLKKDVSTLVATITSCLCLTLPFLGPVLPFELRVILVILFSTVSALLAYRLEDQPKKPVHFVLSFFVPLLFFAWGLIKFGIVKVPSGLDYVNLPIIALLVVGLFLCRKHGTMRAYMIVSLSGYLSVFLKL